jgi:ActR/RegA family two-component response regulator
MFKAARAVLQDCRVLVVEDEYLIAADLAAALGRVGATVVGPISTVAGGERIASESAPINGAVLDMSLRGEMAWPVADNLAERGVPFVFTTGYGRACIPQRHSNVPYFAKPIIMGEVIKALVDRMRRANSWSRSPALSIGWPAASPGHGLRAD